VTGNASADGNYYVFSGNTSITGNGAVHGSVAAMGQIQITGQGQIVGDPNCGKTTEPVCNCTPDDDGWGTDKDKDSGGDDDHGVFKASCDRDDDHHHHKCTCDDHHHHGWGGDHDWH
jgi:hypothetical protein